MKKEFKMAIIATVVGVLVFAGISLYTVLSNKAPQISGEEADIIISEEKEDTTPTDLPPLEDDINLEAERGKITAYVDDQDILTQREMMSLRNHILFTEALTNFLNNAGYPSERIIISPEGAGYEGNTSYFKASVDGYEDVTLYVESYNVVDAFSFILTKGDTVIANSKEQYKKEAEERNRQLEEQYNEATEALGTEVVLDEDDD